MLTGGFSDKRYGRSIHWGRSGHNGYCVFHYKLNIANDGLTNKNELALAMKDLAIKHFYLG